MRNIQDFNANQNQDIHSHKGLIILTKINGVDREAGGKFQNKFQKSKTETTIPLSIRNKKYKLS